MGVGEITAPLAEVYLGTYLQPNTNGHSDVPNAYSFGTVYFYDEKILSKKH